MREILYSTIQNVLNFDRSVTKNSMQYRLLVLLAMCSLCAYPQPWSTFLDSSRAIDWTSAGFTIPNYTVNCATQPTLTAGSGAAAANTTAIQNALASCDATHNVVNIPAGTWYVAGWTYGAQGKQVVRGAGPNSTTIILTAEVTCTGLTHGVCMVSGSPAFDGSAVVLPPSGTQQCLWTAGYAKGTTSITLNNCPGGAPPLNQTLILDQANDMSDTGGILICDSTLTTGLNGTGNGCTLQSGDTGGRGIGGVTHTLQQVVLVTGVSGTGTGPFSVTISPGILSNNIRSGQTPGAWWPGFVQNDGLENITLDGSALLNGTMSMFNCYQCWAKNDRFLNSARNSILVMQGAQNVIRDSYFYGAQGTASQSYGIEFEITSGSLVENNIFQQVTASIVMCCSPGTLIGYNYVVKSSFGDPSFQPAFYGHAGGTQMSLWEGNNFLGISTDAVHGSTANATYFRNMLRAWQINKTYGMNVVPIRAYHRGFNIVGNILGQPGYHDNYESYATSTTGGVNASGANTAIFELGWVDDSGQGVCTGTQQPVVCDSLVRPTLMRWGNWDVVTNGTKWDSTEASPGAVTFANANFTTSYFGSLAHTLPASLYYTSKPSWWPAAKAWPPIGPDVSTGNLGICSGGTYAGAQTTAAVGGCTGGSFGGVQYASHATTIPAQDCYLSTMQGPPDGSGGVLPFDASLCYGTTTTPPPTSTPPASPTKLTITVH